MVFPTGWARQVKLTIDNTKVSGSVNLTNYPALVTEASLPTGDNEIFDADGSHPAINGGGDIRFSSDAAGTTQLACEIVSFVTDNTPANGTAEIWVKVPDVDDATDTDIYIWWEKAAETQPAVTDTYGRNNVWTVYDYVWHLNETPASAGNDFADSTGTTPLDGVGLTGIEQVAGPFGNGVTFAGNDRAEEESDSTLAALLTGYDLTINIIFKRASFATSDAVAVSWEGSDDWAIYPMDDSVQTLGMKLFWRDVGATQIGVNNTGQATATWHWASYTTRASNDHEMYLNGASVGTSSATGGSPGPFTGFYLGGLGSGAQDWGGDIANVGISSASLTDAWLVTEHNNQSSPSTFWTVGTPTAPGVGGRIMSSLAGAGGLAYKGGIAGIGGGLAG